MALPTAYLTSTKRLSEMLDAIKTAQAPEKFTQTFLESLEFKSKSDRLIIGLLKALDFLDDSGKPTNRYYEFLDQGQSAKILADALRDAYSDLFAININAHKMTKQEVAGKLKTLTQGQYSDNVLNWMASTFLSLVALADFKKTTPSKTAIKDTEHVAPEEHVERAVEETSRTVKLGGLVYNIQIVLPESRDPKVYEALFKSLKEHLL